jgi:hypothetical protein
MGDQEKPPHRPLAAAEDELCRAKDGFNSADFSYREASRIRTDALNRLNEAQKKFDSAVSNYRALAPHGSDWKSQLVRNAGDMERGE